MGVNGPEVIGRLTDDLRPFIGRARELGELHDIWPGRRLLTLTGAGGIGKSRLAVELLRRSGDQVVAVADLGTVSDPALTLDAIAMALGLAATPGVPQQDAILAALQDMDGVLFLDTCEHVAERLRAPLQAVLAQADAVRVLATSQVPLGVPGEATWRVPGLALAGDGTDALPVAEAALPGAKEGGPGLDEAAGSDAVRFFLARAREHRPDFAAGGAVLAEVAEICRRLDGIPLALGLAAGWMASVSPALMLEHWDRRAEMLRDPGAGEPRHRTLAAAIEWSAALLTKPDRDLAALISVFAGPATAADVAAVAPARGGAELLSGIRRLVEVSWLEFSPAPEPGFYRMLDPLPTWGLGQLAASGQAEAARRRHAEHFLSLCRQAEARHFRADQGDWPQRLERAAANIQPGWPGAPRPNLTSAPTSPPACSAGGSRDGSWRGNTGAARSASWPRWTCRGRAPGAPRRWWPPSSASTARVTAWPPRPCPYSKPTGTPCGQDARSPLAAWRGNTRANQPRPSRSSSAR